VVTIDALPEPIAVDPARTALLMIDMITTALPEDLMAITSVSETIERCRRNLKRLDTSSFLLAGSHRLLSGVVDGWRP
jgi:hypothetical protein